MPTTGVAGGLVVIGALAASRAIILLGIFSSINLALILLKRRVPKTPLRMSHFVPWVGALASILALAIRRVFVA